MPISVMQMLRISGNVSLYRCTNTDLNIYVSMFFISSMLSSSSVRLVINDSRRSFARLSRVCKLDKSTFLQCDYDVVRVYRIAYLQSFGFVLPRRIVKIDGDQQSNVDQCRHQFHGRQCGRVPKGSHLRIRQTGQQRNQMVHQELIEDDGVLTLFDQRLHEVAKIQFEFLPLLAGHDQWIFTTFLRTPRNVKLSNLIANHSVPSI